MTHAGAPHCQAAPVEGRSCGRGKAFLVAASRGLAFSHSLHVRLTEPCVGRCLLGRAAGLCLCSSPPRHQAPCQRHIQYLVSATGLRSRNKLHSQGLRVKFVLKYMVC